MTDEQISTGIRNDVRILAEWLSSRIPIDRIRYAVSHEEYEALDRHLGGRLTKHGITISDEAVWDQVVYQATR